MFTQVSQTEGERPLHQPGTPVSDPLASVITWADPTPVTWGDDDRRHLMIDPSILLAPRTFDALVQAPVDEQSELLVPASFLTALEPSTFDPDVWRYFAPAARAGRYREEQERPALQHASRVADWIVGRNVHPYTPTQDELSVAQASGTIEIAARLRDRYAGATGQILYEEWLFLQGHSWIGSRTRWAFGRFIWAGGVAVEVGRRGYDAAIEHAREEIPGLVTRPGMKRNIRWIATAGAGAAVSVALPLGGIEQVVIGGTVRFATNQAAKRLFILIDP